MKQNFLKTLNAVLKPGSSKTDSTGTTILDIPAWVGYTFGPLFIVMGLLILTFFRKTRDNANDYKKRQLEQYNKDTGRNEKVYENTKMFLPPWEKIKLSMPLFFGLVFIVIGIAWITGNALSTKNF